MSRQRAVRVALITICNGVLFFFAVSDLLNHSQVVFWRVIAGTVCTGLAAGIILEVVNRKTARLLNVGVPLLLGVILASSPIWLPALANMQRWEHPGDASEGAPYLFIFSLLPFFFAGLIWMLYWMIDGSTEARQSNHGV